MASLTACVTANNLPKGNLIVEEKKEEFFHPVFKRNVVIESKVLRLYDKREHDVDEVKKEFCKQSSGYEYSQILHEDMYSVLCSTEKPNKKVSCVVVESNDPVNDPYFSITCMGRLDVSNK